MKRVNGFLDLDEYFKRILKRKNINRDILEDKNIIRPAFGGANSMFWFRYFGVPILFKVFEKEYGIYSELVSEKLANHLGIKNAQYDTATFEDRKGIISYNFKKDNYKYMALEDIMQYYLDAKQLIKDENADNTYNWNYLRHCKPLELDYMFTNLEDIWNAIERYLYNEINFNYDLIPKLVEKFMLQLTDYFEFQIISGNYDLHTGNITVAIAKDYKDIELSPFYDNEDMFKLGSEIDYIYPDKPRLTVDRETFKETETSLDALKKYLSISDSFFVNKFKEKINKLDENTIYHLFAEVEEKISAPIPEEIKIELAKEFNSNLKAINELLIEMHNKKGV